jgi:hypothetical protein
MWHEEASHLCCNHLLNITLQQQQQQQQHQQQQQQQQ